MHSLLAAMLAAPSHPRVKQASRDSQRQGTVRRRVPHHLAIHILHDWSLLGAALQSCAFNDAYVSEVHVHACCTLSRAARAKEVLMEVEVSCAKHGAIASASPRDGTWQLLVHLLIARRAARSGLIVRSDRAHASRSNGEGYNVRFFTCAQPEGTCVHRCEVRGRTASASAARRVPDGI